MSESMHAYVVSTSPKMLRETLCVVEFALSELDRQQPGYQAGGPLSLHRERIAELIRECDRKRPTGPNGKHDDRHTDECGCPDKGPMYAGSGA